MHVWSITAGAQWSGNVVTPGTILNTSSGVGGLANGTMVVSQVTSDAAAQATTSLTGGGAAGTNTFNVSSATGIVINQLVIGTGLLNSTYVANVSGLTVTLTQNFSTTGSGTYNFYPSGGVGIYTVNTSQTTNGNVAANVSYATLYSTLNGNINAAVLYKISSGNEVDTVYNWGATNGIGNSTAQVHTITIRDVNPFTPFGGNAITAVTTGGNIINALTGTGFVTANVSAFFQANIGGVGPGANSVMRVSSMTSGNIIPGHQLANTVVGGGSLTFGNIVIAQINGTTTPQATAAYSSGTTGSYSMVLTSPFVGTIAPGNLIGNTTGIAAGSYVTSYYTGNTTVFFSLPLTGSPSGTINFYTPGHVGNYIVSNPQGAATGVSSNKSTGAGRGPMPQIFTANANSLLMYLNVDSTAVTNGTAAMVLEGPVVYEDGSDGFAQSQGWGWSMQRTAGVTSPVVYWNRQGSPNIANTLVSTISINPPAGGATVIPPYCAGDNSFWIDPLNGTNPYNLNGTFASTGVTYFGNAGPALAPGALNGKILLNGTVSTTTDVGVNSYHSLATLTGLTSSGQWAGSNFAPNSANMPDATNKNILIHTRPNTPKSLQTTDGIGRSGVKGMAIGMASGTANVNFKVWHVHGAGTLWNPSTFVPLVINNNAVAGNIGNIGSLQSSSINNFGFFVSGSVLAPIWQFGSMWMLDTTIMSGGNAANPVSVAGLLKTMATGKERLSVLEQGVSQALILQPVQFGDGGTNPIYLNMDSTVIEFPQQYSLSSKQVYYNSVDNVVGITYNAGVGDTIIHTNAVVSSQSKFFWRFAPNSAGSALATYNFASTFIQGAGNIVLQPNIALSGITFTRCVEVPIVGANVTNCIYANTAATSGSGACLIQGATQAALQANLTAISNSQFNFNTSGSGALHIQYTGASTAGTLVSLTSTSVSFNSNNFDIYWDAPANTPLLFNQLVSTGVATSAAATNSNQVSLPPIRTLAISGLVTGSNVSIYNANVFASPLVAIAGVTSVGSGLVGTTVGNLTISNDTVNSGKFVATYSFIYTTAFGSASSTTLTLSSVISGNILIGMTVNGTGITTGTTITALGSGVGGAGTYTLSQSATVTAGTYLTFDTPVNIAVLALGYQELYPSSTLLYAGSAVTVNQQIDRQYTNPA